MIELVQHLVPAAEPFTLGEGELLLGSRVVERVQRCVQVRHQSFTIFILPSNKHLKPASPLGLSLRGGWELIDGMGWDGMSSDELC